MTQNNTPVRIKFLDFLLRHELYTLSVMMILIFLKIYGHLPVAPFLIIFLSTLSVAYIFDGMNPNVEANGLGGFFQKSSGFGSAVALTGSLFNILHWPGNWNLLIVGGATHLLLLLFDSYGQMKSSESYRISTRLRYRSLFFLLLLIFLYARSQHLIP